VAEKRRSTDIEDIIQDVHAETVNVIEVLME
jgi:hypothetical protein